MASDTSRNPNMRENGQQRASLGSVSRHAQALTQMRQSAQCDHGREAPPDHFHSNNARGPA